MIENFLPFIKEIDKLKSVERQTLIHHGGRRENSAEHSWHLALSVLVLAELSPEKIDVCKAMKMAVLHDLVEIDAGDTFVYADQSGKADEELKAINRLTGLLPQEVGASLKEIWLEFEEKKSPEAVFVAGLDRFLPVYANYLTKGTAWNRHGITEAQVRAKNQKPITDSIPELWQATEKMIEEHFRSGSE